MIRNLSHQQAFKSFGELKAVSACVCVILFVSLLIKLF